MEASERIAPMDALLFAINLEVLLLQMKIIGTRLPQKNNNGRKLLNEWKFIVDVMKGLLLELVECGEWYTIKEAAEALLNKRVSLQVLKTQNDNLKRSLHAIRCEAIERKQACASELEQCDRRIACLLDELKDCTLNTQAQLNYAEKWLAAKAESHELQLQVKPAVLPKIDHENCVHTELLRAYSLQIEEREDLLSYWETKYFNDTKDIKERVSEQHENLRITTERRKELENLYKLHEGEMRGWLTFKKERAARLAREECARKAATRVQAWWRCVMVQRCLGTFRYLKNSKKGTAKPKKTK